MDTAERRRQVRAPTDPAAMTDLISRCLRSLDEGALEARSGPGRPHPGAVAEMPVGAVHGHDAVPHRTRRGMALSDRTARLDTDDGVENVGDRATRAGAPS
ncbi:hypothetical protein ACPCSL_28505 [Streptomyces griseoincarnatus]